MTQSPLPAAFEISPYCSQLQSKKLIFARQPAQADSDVLDASRHCWCRRTHQALGPDGDAAHPEDCRTGRPCFEAMR